MLAEQWERAKQLFEDVLNLPAEQRREYMNCACADDSALCRFVQELVSNHEALPRSGQETTGSTGQVFQTGDLVAARYRIVRFISAGGMGQVYEVYDEWLNLRLALKTLRPEFAGDREALERFRREVITARGVCHPGICRVIDLVEHPTADNNGRTLACLTMELIEGQNMTDYLREHGPLSPEAALPLIRQIAEAIEVLHSHRVVHRDLKPSNIMLTRRDDGELRATVMDFGLAKLFDGQSKMFETVAVFQAGAPYYMSPELLRGEAPSTSSDIYAFGMIIDDMVTKSKAFPATSVHTLYYQKLWEQPLEPKVRAEHLSDCWNQVILRCLDKRTDRRFKRTSEVLTALTDESAEALKLVPAPVRAVESRRRAFVSDKFRHLSKVIAASLTIFCLLGAAVMTRAFTKQADVSVAVLPIENDTRNAEYSYLCKGTTAELMRRLALFDGLRVIPYYSSHPDGGFDPEKVRYSLSGFLQESDGQIRLTEQLVDNKTGVMLWAHNFDHEVQDPLRVQSEIADGAIQTLQTATFVGGLNNSLRWLTRVKAGSLPEAPTNNREAFDDYIRGRSLFDERTLPAALNAVTSFEKALAQDPKYALAEAALAETQFVLIDFNYQPEPVLLERARLHAEAAIRLQPQLAEGFTALAAVYQTMWDFPKAETAYRQALRLNPKSARAHRWYGGMLLQFARYDEALEQARQAMQLDPYDFAAQSGYGYYLYLARRYSDAEKQLLQTADQKDSLGALVALGDLYLQLASTQSGPSAKSYLQKALLQADKVEQIMRRSVPEDSKDPSIRFSDRMHAEYFAAFGDAGKANAYIDRLSKSFQGGNTSPVSLAMVYATNGSTDQAMRLLEEAERKKDRELMYVKVSPQFDQLHKMDRFQQLLKRMKL